MSQDNNKVIYNKGISIDDPNTPLNIKILLDTLSDLYTECYFTDQDGKKYKFENKSQ